MSALSWAGRACLVTGGAGFGGSHLCEVLLERDAHVCVLDLALREDSYLVRRGLAGRIRFAAGDVRRRDCLTELLASRRFDVIFHLAAQPIVTLSNEMPAETLETNVLGTYALLEAMRATRTKRLVFASSGAVYGATEVREAIPEERGAARITNVYAASKIAAEAAVRCYAEVFDVESVCARFMNTYGPGDTHRSRIVPNAINRLIRGEPLDLGDRDDGTSCLDFVHVRDVAEAYVTLAEGISSCSGEVFNVGSSKPVTVREMVETVARLYADARGGTPEAPIFRAAPRPSPLIKSLDIARVHQRLGWRPRISLEEGLTDTIRWYEEFPLA